MSHSLHFEPDARVLLVTVSGVLTREGYLATYDAIEQWKSERGSCSVIIDFSAIDKLATEPTFATEVGQMRPRAAPGTKRIVIAPNLALFGSVRRIAALRDGTGSDVQLFRSLAEGFAALGLVAPKFVPMEALQQVKRAE